MESKKKDSRKEFTEFIERSTMLIFGVVRELFTGFRYNFIPWNACFFGGIFLCLVYLTRLDRKLWDFIYIGKLYPITFWPSLIYWALLASASFWCWAFVSWAKKRRHSLRLEEVFAEAGLKSSQGRIPKLLFDKEEDDRTHLLRVTIAGATLDKFKKAKDSLESNLGVFIDDIRENRKKKTIDIVYAHEEMPREVVLKDVKNLLPCKFIVGETRSSIVKSDVRKVPHLLIAGQTGGGKSTFLRQFITTHLLNCKPANFILVDLKEGLESHLFAGISNVEIYENVAGAVSRLGDYEDKVSERLKKIKAAKCLDLDEYLRRNDGQRTLEREFIIVDEAAELFLAGGNTKSSDVQRAKKVLSDIARRGRAAGVHLVIATQRPDSRSLDPQVKANLPGVLCFQMVNDASSITVLGTGRATEIPPIPGRAIWKEGAHTVEVQTPLLTQNGASELLKGLKNEERAEALAASQGLIECNNQ